MGTHGQIFPRDTGPLHPIKNLKINKKMGSLPAENRLHQGQGQLPHPHNNILQNPRVPKFQLRRLLRKCQEGVEVLQDVEEVEEQELESLRAEGETRLGP